MAKTIAIAMLAAMAACAGEGPGDGPDESGIGGTESPATEGDSMSSGNASNNSNASESNSDSDPSDSDPMVPKYDVGDDGGDFCVDKEAGTYCDGNEEVECGDNGNVIDSEDCTPDLCVEGLGCTVCTDGQFGCSGDKVMLCDTSTDPHSWQIVTTCDAAAGMACNVTIGDCAPSTIIGGIEPTGVYYQYASFMTGSVFLGGYDVDTFENRIYVDSSFGTGIDVYEVELLDSDGDGDLEPNQHPDNPDDLGPIEERVLTFIETIPTAGIPSGSAEIYALEDRLIHGGSTLVEHILATGVQNPISTVPPFLWSFSHIGFDDQRGVYYASNEGNRRVYQWCESTNTWGIAFDYPSLAGSHMDGIEVVIDPATKISYVYVSDMTSDFLGQYRFDSSMGWVQENLFTYVGTAGSLVEGMGFGALGHFWASGGSELYEIGGGDLGQYTDPPG